MSEVDELFYEDEEELIMELKNKITCLEMHKEDLLKELDKKYKVIELMAEYIVEIIDCPVANCGADLNCEEECDCEKDRTKKCWKKCFYKKVEGENDRRRKESY